jgi:hypothetical protein
MRICELSKQTTTIPSKQLKEFGVLKSEALLFHHFVKDPVLREFLQAVIYFTCK